VNKKLRPTGTAQNLKFRFFLTTAEFTETAAFLYQELFTQRPQRLSGEYSSGSRAYPTVNLGVNHAEFLYRATPPSSQRNLSS
jgi:hypothetical protein